MGAVSEPAEQKVSRLTMALEAISLTGCHCSPEIEIDTEEKQCPACMAREALGRNPWTKPARS